MSLCNSGCQKQWLFNLGQLIKTQTTKIEKQDMKRGVQASIVAEKINTGDSVIGDFWKSTREMPYLYFYHLSVLMLLCLFSGFNSFSCFC